MAQASLAHALPWLKHGQHTSPSACIYLTTATAAVQFMVEAGVAEFYPHATQGWLILLLAAAAPRQPE